MRTELDVIVDGKRQAARKVEVRFGPHHILEISHPEGGKAALQLVATHHGFKADASELDGELEKIINLVRDIRPDLKID